MQWNGKPYHSLDAYLRQEFGGKLYKLSLNGGMTCPNRDGTAGFGGCIFCSEGGSGEFTPSPALPIREQIRLAKERVSAKAGRTGKERYIAYFQAFTNTYAPVSFLEPLFLEAIRHPEIAVLSIATRPDCLPPDVLGLLDRLNRIKPVWVELGLQTIHRETARLLRRGYPLERFGEACRHLSGIGIPVIAHVILGLPGEGREQMLETVRYLGGLPVQGVKLQLLHILRHTELARMYGESPFPLLSLEEYADLVVDAIAWLPPGIVVHRVTGDGPRDLLIAPLWSRDKRKVLNAIAQRFLERGLCQGSYLGLTPTP